MHVQFRQQRGDILLVNNWVNFHRRFAFEDHEDPRPSAVICCGSGWRFPTADRWIPVFIDNYGATGAGRDPWWHATLSDATYLPMQ